MPPAEYVALDLELTGLKVGTAEIIEVGVVRCTPHEVLEEWTTLVRPYTMPDLRIQRLTGIGAEMLRDAPPFEQVAERLRELLTGATPIGHNVRFDLDHLGAAGVDAPRPALDTLPIAQVLDPAAPSHRLMELCARYGLTAEGAHRALVDAEASRRLLLALLERWVNLSAIQREQVTAANAAMGMLSPLRPFLELADADGLTRAVGRVGSRRRGDGAGRRTAPEPPPRVELPAGSLVDLTVAAFESAADAGDGSAMERREEQLAMARDVARSLDASEQAAVEAGTGVGKSLAYLLPAALWAMREGRRVLVSTHTRNLQAQLSSGDFAQLRAMLDLARPGLDAKLRATVLKGRANYLCRRALDLALGSAHSREGAEDINRAMLLARAAVWSEQPDCNGDREALRLARDFDEPWAALSAERVSCLHDGTDYAAMGACFLGRAFDAAAGAHLTVVNHAWLVSNLEAAQQARAEAGLEAGADAELAHLAESDAVIIDEAQFLEDAATNALRTSVDEAALGAALEGIHSADRRRTTTLAQRIHDDLPVTAEELSRSADGARAAVETAWEAYGQFLNSFAEGDAVVFTGGMRAQPSWARVEESTGAAGAALAGLTGQLRELARSVEGDRAGAEGGAVRGSANDRRELAEDARAAADTCEEAAEALQAAIEADPSRTVAWLERRRTRRRRDPDVVALDAAPIDIGAKLNSLIWSRCPRVVLTGATLTVDGEWDFLRGRLGLPELSESQYDSPFDYERNGRIFAATDLPSVQGPAREVAEAQARAILTLARAAEGRTLALFTAHGTMRRVADLVRQTLENDGISLAVQGPDGSPAQVVDDLRANPRTVVFGTAALWTGIDVPGEALSQVIVCRLPFDRPNDPIQSARAEQYENAFAEHQVPTAVLKLRQGVGRLIRRSDDRGIIVVLDDRVARKGYGSRFRAALPPAPYEEAPIQQIAAAVRSFLPPLPAE